MSDALIFGAIRTPRGKGKKDGSLHEVKPVELLAGALEALRKRHGFPSERVDDVVMGCVSPVGEQGGCIAKAAALVAGWDFRIYGIGFPAWTGGALRFIYSDPQRFFARAAELAARCGPRFHIEPELRATLLRHAPSDD